MTGPGEPDAPKEPATPPPGRADHGRHRPWEHHGWEHHGVDRHDPFDRHAPFARQMRARARHMRRHDRGPGPGWGRRRQGFGCVFGFLFLLIVASIVAVLASFLSRLGPLEIVIAAVAAVAILAAIARGLTGAARDLDRTLEATRRVEDGDYGARVGKTRSDLPAIRELARGFDTMAARLEANEEQRRTLLADVSHELRTPLAVITGNLEAILDGVYPADESHLTPILEETRVLERLIDDLRTLTLSEAGTLALHPEPTDPDVLIGDVVRSFTPSATRGGVALVAEVAVDLPILDLDPVRIREVLANLVANALRHTPEGGTVTIGGRATTDEVVLTVADTGPGIEPALRPYVFDRFVKGDGSRGSGLGLAIARGLVEAHGGTISVDSPDGGGTTFRVSLPRGLSPETPTGG